MSNQELEAPEQVGKEELLSLISGDEPIPVEPEPEPEPVKPGPEIEGEPEPIEEITDPEPEPETTGEDDSDEYKQDEWDALTDEERAKATEEYEASVKAEQESEAERVTRLQETETKLKQDALDLEKRKLKWEQKAAESKKEADKDYQRKMELLADEAREAGIADKFKKAKAEARDKPADGESRFGKYVPRQFVTDAQAKQTRMTAEQVRDENARQNALAKAGHDKTAALFNPLFEFMDRETAKQAAMEARKKNEKEWGDTLIETAKELGFELFDKDGNSTEEANLVYGGLYKNGMLQIAETTPVQRANMVRLIHSTVNGSSILQDTGKTIKVPKLPKAPPGQAQLLKLPSAPRRRPPNTLGSRGSGSVKARGERRTSMQRLISDD